MSACCLLFQHSFTIFTITFTTPGEKQLFGGDARPVKSLENLHVKPRPLVHPPKEVIDTKKGTWYPPVLRRPRDLSLTCFDIEGATSTQHWATGRHTDALQPIYDFPGHRDSKPVPPCEPRGNPDSCANYNLVTHQQSQLMECKVDHKLDFLCRLHNSKNAICIF